MNREYLPDSAPYPQLIEELPLPTIEPLATNIPETTPPAAEQSGNRSRRLALWAAGVLAPGLLVTGVAEPVERAEAAVVAATASPNDCPEVKGIPFVGHRGTGMDMYGKYAEDTISAALKAINMGADSVENDIQETRDNKAIMQHDATWDRMTNGHGPIKRTSSSILNRIRNRGGERVATLEGYVKAVASTCASVMLENKMGLSRDTLKLEVALANEHFEDPNRVVFSSSETYTLASLKRLGRGVYKTALILRKDWEWPNLKKLSQAKVDIMDMSGETPTERRVRAVDIINVHFKAITPQRIKAAHSRGFLVSARKVNTEAIFTRMKNWGIDRVVGDINDMPNPRKLLSRR